MGNVARTCVAVAAAALLAGCTGTDTTGPPSVSPAASESPGPTQLITVAAPSMAGNLLGEPEEREALVTLPASYVDGDRRYPVVYFLEGYEESTGKFLMNAKDLDEQMTAAGAREFIIVEADGGSSLGGNFYANSPASGNMADFVAEELVSYVDTNFRTIPEPAARGLSGFSMGGGGTVNLGLSRPDVFGSIYALSPGLFHPDTGLAEMLADNGAWPAYAAAFAPDPSATTSPYAHLLDPAVPLAGQDPAVVAAYESGFGDIDAKVDRYLAAPARLSAIRLSCGTTDSYSWIPTGTAYLDQVLTAKGVDHSLRMFEGGHSIDREFYDGDFVAFFSEQFAAVS